MLQGEALLLPRRHRLAQVPASRVRVVRQKPDAVAETDPQVDADVQVAPLFGFGEAGRVVQPQLREPAAVDQAVDREQPGVGQPARGRRPVPLDHVVQGVAGFSPFAMKEPAHRARAVVEGARVRVVDLGGHPLHDLAEDLLAPAHPPTAGGGVERLDPRGAQHLEAVAGAKSEKEMPRLHADTVEDIGEAQTDHQHVHGLDLQVIDRAHVVDLTLDPARAREDERRAVEDPPEQRAEDGSRAPHPGRGQDAPERRVSLVEVAGVEQLARGLALELHALEAAGARRRCLVHPRRLQAAPGSLEHLGESHVRPPRFDGGLAEDLDLEPVEADRLPERELCSGLLGSAPGVLRGARFLTGPEQVGGQGFGVDARHRLEDAGEAPVIVPHGVARELGDDDLAHAVVEHLDHLAPVAKARAHEAPGTERRNRVVEALVKTRGVADDGEGKRPRAESQEFEQTPSVGR